MACTLAGSSGKWQPALPGHAFASGFYFDVGLSEWDATGHMQCCTAGTLRAEEDGDPFSAVWETFDFAKNRSPLHLFDSGPWQLLAPSQEF